MFKLPISVIAVLLPTAAIAQPPQVMAPKPSGHYLSKPGATDEDYRREMAGCQMRAEIAAPLGPIANFEANMAAVVSQKRIIATCMRANGRSRTTETAPTNAPPPAAKTPPAPGVARTPTNTPPPVQINPAQVAALRKKVNYERYYARTPEAEALGKVLGARRVDDSTNDAAWRASLADALHRYCESVLVQVPRNTPEEDRRVDSEMKWHVIGGASAFDERYQQQVERLKRVEYSVENARKELRAFLSGCSSLAKDLIEVKQTTPAVAEALLWLQLSRYFFADKFILRDAEIAGLVSSKYCNDEEQHGDNLLFSKWAPPPKRS
jgi:hypothetical protein